MHDDRNHTAARFESLLAASGIATWEYEPGVDRLRWSEGVAQLFGLSGGAVPRTLAAYAALLHPDDRDRVLHEINDALARGPDDYGVEHRVRWPDGSVHWLEGKGRIHRDGGGRPVRMAGIIFDVTPRKEAERSVGRVENLFRAVVDDQTEMIVRWKPDGTRTFVNQAYCRAFGAPFAELVGSSFLPLVAESYREAVLARIARLTPDAPLSTDIHKSVMPDGTLRWQEWTDRGLFDAEGRLVELQSVGRDIHDRIEAEEATRRANRALRTLSHCTQALARASTRGDLYRDVCAAIVEQGGYRMAWIGLANDDAERSISMVAHAGSVGDFENVPLTWADNPLGRGPAGSAIRSGRQFVIQDVATDPRVEPLRELAFRFGFHSGLSLPIMLDGKALGALSVYAPDPGAFGEEETRLFGELADELAFGIQTLRAAEAHEASIIEQRRIEEQLRESQKMEAVGQLAGGIAHDFNNILAAIMLQVQLGAELPGLTRDVRLLLSEIESGASRAARLTRQLLQFSRKQVMQPRTLDLNEVVANMATMLQSVVRESVKLEICLHPSALVTHADEGMLDQVLMNLAVNARDAMPDGGTLRLETSAENVTDEDTKGATDLRAGRYVGLRVTDTGTGIASENLPHIFEPFFTTKDPGKGTGLGLATVFGIVKQHGGTVTVASTAGAGTTFTILLRASEGEPSPLEASARALRGGHETILVAEDEEAVRKLMCRLLRRYGYVVIEAASGVEAARHWEAHRGRIHLLVSDIVMPDGLDGRDLAAMLRARDGALKVLLISGYSRSLAGQEIAEEAGLRFLPKPFGARELLEAVRRSLDK